MNKNEKIVKNYVYEGLGFPVILEKTRFEKIRGEWLPQINIEKLTDIIFELLPKKPSKLTGNEIKFIRTYLGKSKPSFAETFKLSHTAISKWESAGNMTAPISPSQEIVLRLYLEDYLQTGHKKFYQVYKCLEQSVYEEEEKPLKVAL